MCVYMLSRTVTCKFNVFQYHTAVGQVWMEMTRQLADSLILPLNVSDLADVVTDLSNTLLDDFGELMDDNNVKTGTKLHFFQCLQHLWNPFFVLSCVLYAKINSQRIVE